MPLRLFLISFLSLLWLSCFSQTTLTSVQTGDWDDATTWGGSTPSTNDTVIIETGHTVTLPSTGGPIRIGGIKIRLGGKLDQGNKSFEVEWNYLNDGKHVGNAAFSMTGDGSIIDGTGALFLPTGGVSMDIDGDKLITDSADLDFNIKFGTQTLTITNATIQNFGIVEISALTTDGGTSLWENKTGAALGISGGSWDVPLDATAVGNIVEFANAGDFDVFDPISSQYSILNIGGVGTKSLTSNLQVDFLNISSTLDVTAANNYKLTIKGNFINNGTFLPQNGEVEFSGLIPQTIDFEEGNSNSFYDLRIDNALFEVSLEGSIFVNNQLFLDQGNLDTEEFRITIGEISTTPGSISRTSGHIIGELARQVNSTNILAGIEFPVGDESDYTLLEVDGTAINTTPGVLVVKWSEEFPSPLNPSPTSEDGFDFYNPFGDGLWEISGEGSFELIDPDISVRISDLDAFPVNTSQRYIARPNSGSNWTFEGTHLLNDGTTISRLGLNTINSSSPRQLAVVDTTNCTPPSSPVFQSGDTTVCTGDLELYSIQPTTDSIVWELLEGGSLGTNGNDTIDITWETIGGVRLLSVFLLNTCSFSEPLEKTIDVEPFPTSSVSGKQKVAIEDSNRVYSVEDNGYTYTWTLTSNLGTIASGQGTDSIVIHWGSNAGTEVINVEASNGCPLTSSNIGDVNVFLTFISANTGDFTTASTWQQNEVPGLGDNIEIRNPHTVSLTQDEDLGAVLIDSGGTLDNDGKKMIIGDLYVLDGTHNATSGGARVTFNGLVESDIDGNGGVLNAKSLIMEGVIRDVVAGADITINATAFDIDNASLRNFGTLRISDAISVTNGGTLNASEFGNTIVYDGTAAQDVLTPEDTTFYNLTIENAGTKSTSSNIQMLGDLNLNSGVLDVTAGNYTTGIVGDWNNNGGTFNEGTGTVVFNGTSNLNGDETFYDVEINQSLVTTALPVSAVPTLNLNSDLFITNGLNLVTGYIDSDSTNLVSIASGSTVSAPSIVSYVEGPVEYTGITAETLVFPFGRAGIPHQLDLVVNGPNQDYFADYIPQSAVALGYTLPASLNRVSSVGYWGISTASAVTTAAVTLYYGSEDQVTEPLFLRVAKDDGMGAWVDQGGTGTAAPSGSITSTTNFTQFSAFSLANDTAGENPLPIQIIDFQVNKLGEEVEVYAEIFTQPGLKKYWIERSKDGKPFDLIYAEDADPSLDEILTLIHMDDPGEGRFYYRIGVENLNGEQKYSPIRFIELFAELGLSVYPIPFNEYLIVELSGADDLEEGSWEIHSLTGTSLMKGKLMGQRTLLNVEDLQAGSYLIRMKFGGRSMTHSLVK